jgi:hypothetical protein
VLKIASAARRGDSRLELGDAAAAGGEMWSAVHRHRRFAWQRAPALDQIKSRTEDSASLRPGVI